MIDKLLQKQLLNAKTFTSSGTYTPSPATARIEVAQNFGGGAVQRLSRLRSLWTAILRKIGFGRFVKAKRKTNGLIIIIELP